MENEYRIVIDDDLLVRYDKFYFSVHTKAKKRPIPHPYHESINTWMIMKRPMMNALKQRWKEAMKWIIGDLGYSNLHINKCEVTQIVYYPTSRRHDTDNSCPKFILDGLVESGMIVDDDCKNISKLTLQCGVDTSHPRTELIIKVME